MKRWFHTHQLPQEEADQEYHDEPVDAWEDFKLEMRSLVEEFEKKTEAHYTQPQRNEVHASYIPISTSSSKGVRKQASHQHCPQKMKPAIEKSTIKQAKGSQPKPLKLLKVPETCPRLKGDTQPT